MSNIRVCLRVKPRLGELDSQPIDMKIKKLENSSKLYFNMKKSRAQTKIFSFDEIYTENVAQSTIYDTLKEDLVNSALTGVSSSRSSSEQGLT